MADGVFLVVGHLVRGVRWSGAFCGTLVSVSRSPDERSARPNYAALKGAGVADGGCFCAE